MKLDRDDGHVVPSVSGQNRDGQVRPGCRLKYGKKCSFIYSNRRSRNNN